MTSSQRSRPSASATGSPSSRRSSTPREACTCAQRATGGFTSTSGAARPPVAPSPCCATCGIRSEIRTYRRRAFDTATRYQLHVAGDAETLAVLVAAGVVDRRHAPLVRPPRRVVARSCCRAAYLRGAFLGAGSLSLGRSPHLELRTASAESAALLARLRECGGGRARDRGARESRRCVRQELGGDRVAARLMGAAETVLALEERAVVAETRSRANRLANADHANLVRTSRSARTADRGGRTLLDDERRGSPTTCARWRSFGSATRRRRCASSRARADPAATRVAVHRRLRRLEELAG